MQGKKTVRKKKQATKEDYEKRLDEIIELINSGKTVTSIVKHMSNKHKISDRQAYRIIEDAKLKMTHLTDTNLYYHVSKSFGFKNTLIEKAMDKEDYRLAFDIQKDVDDKIGVTGVSQLLTIKTEFFKLFIEELTKSFIQLNDIESKNDRFEHFLAAMREGVSNSYRRSAPKLLAESVESGESDEPVEKILDCVL